MTLKWDILAIFAHFWHVFIMWDECMSYFTFTVFEFTVFGLFWAFLRFQCWVLGGLHSRELVIREIKLAVGRVNGRV